MILKLPQGHAPNAHSRQACSPVPAPHTWRAFALWHHGTPPSPHAGAWWGGKQPLARARQAHPRAHATHAGHMGDSGWQGRCVVCALCVYAGAHNKGVHDHASRVRCAAGSVASLMTGGAASARARVSVQRAPLRGWAPAPPRAAAEAGCTHPTSCTHGWLDARAINWPSSRQSSHACPCPRGGAR
jgi:hypothetical protein